jgi:hypothetical protein
MPIRWRSLFVTPKVRLLADRAAPGGAARRQAELDISGLLCGL